MGVNEGPAGEGDGEDVEEEEEDVEPEVRLVPEDAGKGVCVFSCSVKIKRHCLPGAAESMSPCLMRLWTCPPPSFSFGDCGWPMGVSTLCNAIKTTFCCTSSGLSLTLRLSTCLPGCVPACSRGPVQGVVRLCSHEP
jgi:hypothetical protein